MNMMNEANREKLKKREIENKLNVEAKRQKLCLTIMDQVELGEFATELNKNFNDSKKKYYNQKLNNRYLYGNACK